MNTRPLRALAAACLLGGGGLPRLATACDCRDLPATAAISDRSVFQIDGTWTDDSGQRFALSQLSGRPTLVAMFYTHCGSACPLTVIQIKALLAQLPEAVRKNLQVLLVSFDSKADTPEVLARYRQVMGLEAPAWHLVNGSPDQVRTLSMVLGINYAEDANGQFTHSNAVTLLNPQGEITFQHKGLTQDLEDLRKVLIAHPSRLP